VTVTRWPNCVRLSDATRPSTRVGGVWRWPTQRLPEPGPNDRVREADAVADDGGLLRMTVPAVRNRHRHLLGGDTALDRLDQELRGVELLLAQDELGQDVAAHRSVPIRAVADLGAGDEGDHPVEEHDPELPRVVVRLGVAEHTRAVGDGDLTRKHGLD